MGLFDFTRGATGARRHRVFSAHPACFGHSTLYIFGDYGAFTSVCACISPLNATVWRCCTLFVQREMFIRRNAENNRVQVYNVDPIHVTLFR